jgi:hypothetical protein
VDDSRSGYLSSTWNVPTGTIEEPVANVSSQTCLARPNISGSEIMTIDGHRGRGAAASSNLGFDETALACFKILEGKHLTRPQLQGA